MTSFPRPPSNAHSSKTDSNPSRVGQSAWGTSASGTGRGSSPVSTAFSSQSRPSTANNDSTLRSPWSPSFNASSNNTAAFSANRAAARSPSVTSPPPGLAPPGLSGRSRTATHSSSSAHTPGAAGISVNTHGTGGGGTNARSRGSPSLTQSSYTSPTSASHATFQASGQSGSLNKIATTQLVLLLSTLKDDKDKSKWDTEVEKIRKLVDDYGHPLFIKMLQRLIVNNAPTIWGTARGSEPLGNYRMLVDEIKKVTMDFTQPAKIVEAVESGDSEVFRNFDLSTFMEHFKISALGKIVLASAFKRSSKTDLRTKADAIISNNLSNCIQLIASSSSQSIPDELIAIVIDRLAQCQPRNWNLEYQQMLEKAILTRYESEEKAPPLEITSSLAMFQLIGSSNSLIRLVHRAGPRSTETVPAAKVVVDQFDMRDIEYEKVGALLLYMAISHDDPPYNLNNFVTAFREHRGGQQMDWRDVIHAFDRNGVSVSKKHFKKIYDCLLPIAQENEDFDIQLLWGGQWRFEAAQLSFVAGFLSHAHTELDASRIPRLRTAFRLGEVTSLSPRAQDFYESAVRHPYVSLDAIKALLHLAFQDHSNYDQARKTGIIDDAVNINVDLFVTSTLAVPRPWSPVQETAVRVLVEKAVGNASRDPDMPAFPGSEFLFRLLQQKHPLLLKGYVDKMGEKIGFLDIYLNLALNLNILEELVDQKDEHSLPLATRAHAVGQFDLSAWLTRITSGLGAGAVVPAVRGYLVGKIQDDASVKPPGAKYLKTCTVHCLLTFLGKQGLPEGEQIELQRNAISSYPRLVNYDQGYDSIIDGNDNLNDTSMSVAADGRMMEQYRMMWEGEQDVKAVIELLRSTKVSEDADDQELFASMIHGLFDEYSSFGQYPQKELSYTALLFGSIIGMGLLSNIALQVALSMVLECVRDNHPDELLFKFGLQAIVQFKDRLHEWDRLCEHLVKIEGLKTNPEIFSVLEDIARKKQYDLDDAGVPKVNGDSADHFLAPEPGIAEFDCLSADPSPYEDEAQEPDTKLQEEVLFVLNNISQRNLSEKVGKLKAQVRPEYYQWFANILVDSRIKPQPNFQPLYMELLEHIDDRDLWSEVLRGTFVSVIKMLNSQATMESSNERTLLKNLGSWLGSMTLARNQSIKHRNIAFRELLVEAHDKQRLQVAIPFTCKVLASVVHSVVFRPPCAWTMEILEILIELYHFFDLKITLKFEVEVLCKALSLDHKDITPSTIVRSRPMPSVESLGAAMPDGLDAFAEGSVLSFNRRIADRLSPATMISLDEIASILKHTYTVHTNDQRIRDGIEKSVCEATAQAVSEILGAVVERSVTIASIAASQIVQKDFDVEPDITKMRDSAHTMVCSLSGSLAAVTCKEPLRNQMHTNITSLRAQIAEQLLPPGSMHMFVSDNLEAVCGVIEKVAAKTSAEEIDMQLDQLIRDRQNGDFVPGRHVSQWANFLPEPFKMSGPGLKPEQLAIYSDFHRVKTGQLTHHANGIQDTNRDLLPDQFAPNLPSVSDPTMNHTNSRRIQEPAAQPHGMVNGFTDAASISQSIYESTRDLFQAVEEAANQDDMGAILTAPRVQDAHARLLHCVQASLPEREMAESTALMYAARELFNLIAASNASLRVLEPVVFILQKLANRLDSLYEVVYQWCNDVREGTFFEPVVMTAFLKAGFVNLPLLDKTIAYGLMQGRPGVFEFTSQLVEQALLADDPVLWRSDLANAVDALMQCVATDRQAEQAQAIARKLGGSLLANREAPPGLGGRKETQMGYIFEEWTRLQAHADSQYLLVTFAQQLSRQKFSADQENLTIFVKAAISSCTQNHERAFDEDLPVSDDRFAKADALAHLIALLVEVQAKRNGSTQAARIDMLHSILTTMILALAFFVDHGQSAGCQMTFHRVFSTLAYDFQATDSLNHEELSGVLYALSDRLLMIEPRRFPAFAGAWLSLLSHPVLLPCLLRFTGQQGRELYAQLLSSQLDYASDLLQVRDPGNAVKDLYRGTVKLLVVLHHDFPEFVAEHAYHLLGRIPAEFSQFRSLIVSASPVPSNEVPDPFTDGLRIDRLDEASQHPLMAGEWYAPLSSSGLDSILASHSSKNDGVEAITDEIVRVLMQDAASGHSSSFAIDETLLDAILIDLPLRFRGVQNLQSSSMDSTAANLIKSIVPRLDVPSRYAFLSHMADHLRFPNSYTIFYSQLFLNLFRNGDLGIQQTVFRVLMDRMVVHRPQTWGVLVTMLELCKNNDYRLFNMPFVKAVPEVERMLVPLLQSMSSQRQ